MAARSIRWRPGTGHRRERATRLLTYVIGSTKRYSATIRLGETTVTDDAEGELTASASPPM